MTGLDFEFACHACGTSLRGLLPDAWCQHCGERVVETLDLSLIDVGSGLVHEDVACATCEYNLRTLHAGANCPECFTPVIRSLRPEQLSSAAPEWLARMRGGMTCLIVSMLGLLLAPVATFAFTPGWAFAIAGMMGMGVTILLSWLIFVVGIIRLNSPEPASGREASSRRIRALAQLLAFGSVLGVVGTPFLSLWFLGGGLFAGLGSCILFVSLILTVARLHPLARRARRPGVVRLSTALLWLLISTVVALAGGSVVSLLVMRQAMAWTAVTATMPAAVGYTGRATTSSVMTNPSGSVRMASSGPAGAVNPIVTTGAPAFPFPMISPALQVVSVASACVIWPLLLSSYVVGLVAAFKYRGIFKAALRRSLTPLGVTE